MGNIIDYARTETRSFEALPFREADALVLAQLSYDEVPECVLRLDDLVAKYGTLQARAKQFDIRRPIASLRMLRKPPFGGVTIARADDELNHDKPVADHDVENVGLVDPQVTHDFYHAVAANPRFSDVEMSAYCEQFDGGAQTQFAAVTFRLPSGTLVVAFRGTDDSLVGWKEDFNMAFTPEIPAQRYAADYLQQAAAALAFRPLLVGGHSKGGNLAVYAAVFCGEAIQKQIRAVYNNDGPGFYASLLELPEHRRIAGKITTLLPESSVVGMLLEHEEAYQVVRSTQIGLMQHDGFSWQVLGERFEHLTELAEGGRIMDQTLRSFLRELTEPQRAQFVDTLFDILTCTDASTLTDLKVGGLKTASAMVKALQKLDKPTRKALSDTLKLLVRSGARSVLEELGVNRLRENRLIEALSGYLESHSRT